MEGFNPEKWREKKVIRSLVRIKHFTELFKNVSQRRRKPPKAGWASCNGGHNLSPLVDIGITDPQKTGWVIAHPAHPCPTSL